MIFIKIENIDDYEEMSINIENISLLIKRKKFKMVCSNSPPYEFIEREQINGEFEYFVVMKNESMFNINKEDYELIKSKIGV